MLCFRCGSHNPDGSEFCSQCGQKFVDRKTSRDPTSPEMQAEKNEAHLYSKDDEIAERYKVRAVVDSGPVGVVYRTHDLEIDVDVAVKVIEPKLLQTKDERRHFLSEIRSIRKIKHGNIIRLYDEDEDRDRVFFTMQMLEGLSLRKIIKLRKEKNQDFQIKEIIPIFSHICQALDLAHETTAHGDLKPENIIVLPDLLKITDFGLIHAIPHQPFVAAQKGYAQSISYLAPEIRADKPTIEPAADIYSLGVILCEMLTSKVYEGPSSSLPPLPKENEGLSQILIKALNENPSKRYRTPREFFEDLHKATSASPSSSPRPPRPAPTREADTPPPIKKPPRSAPSRKESYTVGDPMDPPTVVGASVLKDDDSPSKASQKGDGDEKAHAEEEKISPNTMEEQAEEPEEEIDNELLDDAEFESMEEQAEESDSEDASSEKDKVEEIEDFDEVEEIEEDLEAQEEEAAEQVLDESDIEEEEDIQDDGDIDEDLDTEPVDDQETLVTTPLTSVDEADARVARPKDVSPPPSDKDDIAGQLEDKPEQVEVLKARKRQNTQPVQAIMPTAPSASSQPLPPPQVSQPPMAGPVIDQTQPNMQSYPPVAYSYPPGVPGAYSQPPYGYSQPPPSQSRLPVYIFLSVITVIVGVAVFFLVDYLIAAKKQLSGPDNRSLASSSLSDKNSMIASTSEREKALAEQEKKLAAEKKRVEDYLKAQEAKIAEERKKMEEAKKADEARLAAMKPQPKESQQQFEKRKEEERKKAEAKRLEAEKKLARQKKLAEQRRKAEEARLAAKRKKAAEERRKAEQLRKQREKDKKASIAKNQPKKEDKKKIASNKPMLEEIPLEEVPVNGSGKPAPVKSPATSSSTSSTPKSTLEPRVPEGAKTIAKVAQPDLPPQKPSSSGKCPKGMVFIPDGDALVGSSSNDPMRNFGELTIHKVSIKGFCIDRYEYPNIRGKKPKTNVTWKQAQRLCKRRGKRLCTESEWEYACKGKGNRSFPYGKKWDPNRCNTEDASGNDREVSAIGSFKSCRSPYGVMDMSGNVSEWTQDKYRSGTSAKTYKGGSATRPNWASRCASRSSLSPGARKADLGFRCCANPK